MGHFRSQILLVHQLIQSPRQDLINKKIPTILQELKESNWNMLEIGLTTESRTYYLLCSLVGVLSLKILSSSSVKATPTQRGCLHNNSRTKRTTISFSIVPFV